MERSSFSNACLEAKFVELLLDFGSEWKLLPIFFIDFFPNITQIIPNIVLEVFGMGR